MTVTLVTGPQKYVGLSSDAKPRDTTIVAGAAFHEDDTGKDFIYDGSNWYLAAMPSLPGQTPSQGPDLLSVALNMDQNLQTLLTIVQAALVR